MPAPQVTLPRCVFIEVTRSDLTGKPDMQWWALEVICGLPAVRGGLCSRCGRWRRGEVGPTSSFRPLRTGTAGAPPTAARGSHSPLRATVHSCAGEGYSVEGCMAAFLDSALFSWPELGAEAPASRGQGRFLAGFRFFLSFHPSAEIPACSSTFFSRAFNTANVDILKPRMMVPVQALPESGSLAPLSPDGECACFHRRCGV